MDVLIKAGSRLPESLFTPPDEERTWGREEGALHCGCDSFEMLAEPSPLGRSALMELFPHLRQEIQ